MGVNITKRVLGWQDEHRARIAVSKLIDRLQDHAFANRDRMTPSQVQTCFGLLRKALPDLTTLTIDTHSQVNHVIRFEWLPPEEPRTIEGVSAHARDLETTNGAQACFAGPRETNEKPAALFASEQPIDEQQPSEAPGKAKEGEKGLGDSDSTFDEMSLPRLSLKPRK